MLSYLIWFECKAMLKSMTFWALMSILAIFLLYGANRGGTIARKQNRVITQTISEQNLQRNQYQMALRSETEDSSQVWQQARNADIGYHYTAVLPKHSLAAISVGQSEVLPSFYGIGMMTKARQKEDRYGYENPLLLAAGNFDLSTVIIYLVPLIIIALNYQFLSQEREKGTLQLVLSNPVSLHTYIWGKILPRIFFLNIHIAFFSLLGLYSAGTLFSGEGKTLVLVLLLILLYILCWFLVCIFVNVWGFSSSTNALLLVVVWLFFLQIIPSFSHSVAQLRFPSIPRTKALLASRENPLDFVNDVEWLAKDWYSRNADLITPDRNAGQVAKTFGNGFYLVQEKMDQQGYAIEHKSENRILAQLVFEERLSFLSPAATMRLLLDHIAGTDATRHAHFRSRVEEFRIEWRKFFSCLNSCMMKP